MDREHIEPLEKLTKLIDEFLAHNTQANFMAYATELRKFMGNLFLYHSAPETHQDPMAFFGRRGRVSSGDFPKVLRELVEKGEDQVFLSLCPFSATIIELYELNKGFGKDGLSKIDKANLSLKAMINNEKVVKPLQEMRELFKALVGQKIDLSVSENITRMVGDLKHHREHALGLVGAVITRSIPPGMQSRWPYKLIDWRKLQVLADKAYDMADSGRVKAKLGELEGDFHTLIEFLDNTIIYEQMRFDQEPVFPNLQPINQLAVIEDLAREFEDPMNLKVATEYLSAQVDITNDSKTNRLAILRLITVIGEVSKNLSTLLTRVDDELFESLKTLRDGIIHADEYPSVEENLNSLINNGEDKRLFEFAAKELPLIRAFFNALEEHVNTANPLPAPISPSLTLTSELKTALTKDYKLTTHERQLLIQSLPLADKRFIAEQRKNLESVLKGIAALPGSYDDFKPIVQGLALSGKRTKDMFVKLTQLRLATEIETMLANDSTHEEIKRKLAKIQSKDERFILFSTQDSLDLVLLKAFVQDHKNLVKLSDKEIAELIEKVPETEIDIKEDKERLRRIVNQEEGLPERSEFLKILDRVNINNTEQKNLWIKALEVLSNREESTYKCRDKSYTSHKNIYRYIYENIERVQRSIGLLNELTATLKEVPEGLRQQAFLDCAPLILACEYAFNVFVDSAKELNSKVGKAKDYDDVRSRSIFLTHPIDELQRELDSYVRERNNIFHLNLTYTQPWTPLAISHMQLYSAITHRTEGILYPDSIVITNMGPDQESRVTREAIRADSLYKKLESIKEMVLARSKTESSDHKMQTFRSFVRKERNDTFLESRETRIIEITPDGNCMFNSILEGLTRIASNTMPLWLRSCSAETLRRKVADYIEANTGLYFDEIAGQISQNIRDDELIGYPDELFQEMNSLSIRRKIAYATGVGIDKAEEDIIKYGHGGAVGTYIRLLGLRSSLWGGPVELGVISKLLGVQIQVHRRDGEIYHINNTENSDAPKIHLDYTGTHYNLLLPRVSQESINPRMAHRLERFPSPTSRTNNIAGSVSMPQELQDAYAKHANSAGVTDENLSQHLKWVSALNCRKGARIQEAYAAHAHAAGVPESRWKSLIERELKTNGIYGGRLS